MTLVAGEVGVFGFQAAGIMAGAAFFVGDSAQLQEILHDGVAPDDGVAGLVFEAVAHMFVELGIDAAFERRPLVATNSRGLRRALVVAVVDVLDDGLAVVQLVGVGHVVEEEEQVVGGGGQGLVDLGHLGGYWPTKPVPVATVRSMPTPRWSALCHWPQPLRSLDSMLGP